MSVPPVARIRRVPPAEAHARKRDGAPAAVRLHRPRLDPAAAAFARYLTTPPGSAAARSALRAYATTRSDSLKPQAPSR